MHEGVPHLRNQNRVIRSGDANTVRRDSAGNIIPPRPPVVPAPVEPAAPVRPGAPTPVAGDMGEATLRAAGADVPNLDQAVDVARRVPGRVGDADRANRLMERIRMIAPNLFRIIQEHGWGALDPNIAALLNAEMIEEARIANEEQIWGESGLINKLGGAVNNQDQISARAAIESLLNSNDPFFDRMQRQIQDQYGIQSRDALQAAAQRFGAQGRNFSDYHKAMLSQQQRGLMSQAINQNEMARYSAQQGAREKASQLYMGLSADMREQLGLYASYVAAFPQTTPSFEAFIFPPERDDTFNILGMEGVTRSGGVPEDFMVAGQTLTGLETEGATTELERMRQWMEERERRGGAGRHRGSPNGLCVAGIRAEQDGNSGEYHYFNCDTGFEVDPPPGARI